MRVLVITTIFTILAGLFVATRLFTRLHLVKRWGYDDLIIVAAFLCSALFYTFTLVERNHGLGEPKATLSQSDIEKNLFYLWLSIPFYNAALILAKISATLFLTSIFRLRRFLITSYILIGFLVIAGLWMVISGFVFCVPVSTFWSGDKSLTRSKCLPEGPVWFTNAGIHIVTDIIILILPMPVLYRLQLDKRLRVGIMLIFGVGIFVIATSSARVYELSRMVGGHDFTKTNAEAAVWSSLEANVSIICACLPPLHTLLSRLFSYCFRPQPLNSSPASKAHSNTTFLSSSRKPSIYDHQYPDGGIFYNDTFYSGQGGNYTASISKNHTAEYDPESGSADSSGLEGIRVVRELRVGSDSVAPSSTFTSNMGTMGTQEHDFEMQDRGPSVDFDLADFEFPDYKERMNAPL
ncbi:hypothetical protein PENSTE_c002G07906 [Penicillium steckii]|uniref:Rhodopsin domain-containing protein n=1 Tax=Penicillium steckii TaxID=303698 RepID=A0A1V6TVJ9_9EURO|nr:hypothetical protein PENSTE_c002G07906 [Penicillium steckii]